ncbi:hypothetical protein PR202_ga03492 [Eleusine coracana subsp. coracana]|uniref:Major facilitator superfamily (MFS) profile domain-containing protein n=1 Tax=Eleusine coracana subsp. coracana TaxID=191504 RepID=A0AAV5BPJ6_ELECO|nr:hypothetical protein PR202_ga03492 [Eleusine coracana subsp. coracana]
MLIASSLLYSLSGLMMMWSPNVYVLLLSRLVDGFGIGLAVTLVPVYISETAPPEIRGLLNTLPQFTGSGGMFLSYCMVFAMTLSPQPNWRLMLGVLFLPSLLYLLVTLCFLPESPRWLVSKGRMKEARAVLQMLRGRDDVDGEMALLVEGLSTGGETAIEEYVVGPDIDCVAAVVEEDNDDDANKYGSERGMSSWVAQGSVLGSALIMSRQGSMLMDPLVTLLGSVHDLNKVGVSGGGSMLFSSQLGGSMLSFYGGDNISHKKQNMDWDEENNVEQDKDDDDDDDLRSPLLDDRGGSSMTATMGIGGGWQLAWKYTDDAGVKRMYLHEEESHAAALVSQSALCLPPQQSSPGSNINGPAILHPAAVVELESKNNNKEDEGWRQLLAPGVRHALACGVTMQILQQFSGINGVLYYTPQILDQAGVSVLLANLGLSSDSTSILISGLTTLLMLPTIAVAMRLMDVSGRRSLLLWTIPVLIASLAALVVASVVPMPTTAHAGVATGSVMVYLCCFVMGFGPIPNILSYPVMLNAVGLAGVFGFYAVVCCLAFVFVALRVPETKGLPLEVIIEFFNIGATTKHDSF